MNKLAFSAVLLLPLATFAQDGFTLKGKIGTVSSPAKVYLQYRGAKTVVVDSAEVKNGVFEFKGKVESPTTAQLLLMRNPASNAPTKRSEMDALGIYLENKTISVTAPDSVKNAVIKGSPLNDDNIKLTALLKASSEEMAALDREYSSKPPEQQQDPAYRQSLVERSEAIQKKAEPIQQKFVDEHPNSYVSLVTFRGLIGYDIDPATAEPPFNKFSAELRNTPLGKSISEAINIAKRTAIGSAAADFTQNDVNGKPVKLSSFRGKYVLIDFWASWCGPCRDENPNVVSAYQRFKDKKFTVLGVSLDRPNGKEAWVKAIKDDGLTWTQVSDLKYFDNEAAKLYGIQAIPSNVLVDPNGKIVAKNLREEGLHEKLEELLGSGVTSQAK